MKFIAIGDNVCDCYLDQQLYYPGGNAVNVAVNCKRNGFGPCAYMGVFGNDNKARHLMDCLTKEGVSFDYSRQVYAVSGSPRVSLVDGDRKFIGGKMKTAQRIVKLQLTPADIDYVQGFDLCHSSCYSSIEGELAKIAQSCPVSYDFSTRYEESYLRQVCPHIRFAFFSGAGLSPQEIDKLFETCHTYGVEIVCVTLGGQGALFSKDGKRYTAGIDKVEVVDTMGAGDSFIAGFLTRYMHTEDMELSLRFAKECGARACTYYGGFGYPHPFDGDETQEG